MPDSRTLREKLVAMAGQTDASPKEAELAREALARLDTERRVAETGRVLTRSQILGAPDRSAPVRSIRFWSQYAKSWIVVDEGDEGDAVTFSWAGD